MDIYECDDCPRECCLLSGDACRCPIDGRSVSWIETRKRVAEKVWQFECAQCVGSRTEIGLADTPCGLNMTLVGGETFVPQYCPCNGYHCDWVRVKTIEDDKEDGTMPQSQLLSEVYGEQEFKPLKVGDFVRLAKGNVYMLARLTETDVGFICVRWAGFDRPAVCIETKVSVSTTVNGVASITKEQCEQLLGDFFRSTRVITQDEALAAMAKNEVQ